APAGGATQGCESANDCPVPDCMGCPDGSVVCPIAQCVNGNCAGLAPLCPAVVPGSCIPALCAGVAGGVGCCITPNGPCGADFGNGCVDTSGCQSGGCTVPPGDCAGDSDCSNVGPSCHI